MNITSLFTSFPLHANDEDPASQLSSQSRVLVSIVDVLIAAIIVFFVLLRLPRAAATFWKTSELKSGHFLLSNASVNQTPPCPSEENQLNVEAAKEAQSPTSDNHDAYSASQGLQVKASCPPHIPAYPTLLRPLGRFLQQSIIPRYSNQQVIVMVGYFGILLFAFVYHNQFLTIPIRPSWIAVSQLPILYGFSAKNNVVGWLMGLGYQNLNYLHRFAGRLIVLAVNVHAIGILHRWSLAGEISVKLKTPSHRWGATALISLDIVFLFSLGIWRAKRYKTFRITHVVGYLLIIPAIYEHQPTTLPYIIAVAVVYLSDRVFSLSKTHLVTATIRPLPALSSTWIEIKSLNYGWRAGQHVRIRILSTSLGWLEWVESHPFTIASAPVTSGKNELGVDGLVLICKKTGGWTTRLYDMANAPSAIEGGTSTDKTVRLLIEGPYGGPGHAIFASYSAVVIIAGGSGISFALATIQDLVQKGLNSESRVQAIELVWVVRYQEAVNPLLPLFSSLMKACSYLSITIHYTRAQAPQPDGNINNQEGNSSSDSPPNSLDHLNQLPLIVKRGRPERTNFIHMMERAITNAVNRDATDEFGGLLVGVCGPPELEQDVALAVDSLSEENKDKIGGVEMHVEVFGL